MTRALKIEVIGKEALLRKLNKGNFKRPVDESIRKITTWFAAEVKVSTPVDTGHLRSSIASRIEPQGGAVFTNKEYAPFVEYGTHKMVARYVVRGSSSRKLGKGPFTYVVGLLKDKMKGFSQDIVKKLKVRFD